MPFDAVTYAAAKGAAKAYTDLVISNLPKGFVYKGAVDYYDLLPANPQAGDVYTVVYKGTSPSVAPWGAEFVWGNYEGTNQWIELNSAIEAIIDVEALPQTDINTYAIYRYNNQYYIYTNNNWARIAMSDDLNSKQDLLVSGTNIKTVNGNSILGSGNIAVNTYQPFPNGQLNGTLQQVVSAIMAFPGRKQGMAYLGGIAGSCTPFGYGNVECTVTFMTDSIALLSVSSSDITPHYWLYNTAQNDYQWRAYEIQSNKVTAINSSSTDVQYPSAKAVYDYHDSTKQDTLVSGTNIKTVNGNSVLGSGNIAIRTYKPFPASWPVTTGTTIATFCAAVNASFANGEIAVGDAFLGNINSPAFFSGAHVDGGGALGSAEVSVQIMTPFGSNCVQLLTVTSSNNSPYHWEYTYVDGAATEGWRAYEVQGNKVTSISSFSTNDQYPSALAVYNSLSGKQNVLNQAQLDATNSGITSSKVSIYDGYASNKQDTLSSVQLTAVNSGIDATKVAQIAANTTAIAGKQDTLTAGTNITIQNNVISATGSSYTAGSGIEITQNEIAVDPDYVALKDDIPVGTLDVNFNGTATASTSTLSNIVVGTQTYTVPTANDGILTLQKNGTTVDTFSANAAADKTINIQLSKTDVGLGNVDNTSDLNKPISTATQTALNTKQNTLPTTSTAGKVLKSTSTAGTVEWGDTPSTGVTSITAGNGLTGGTITSTGTIAVDTSIIAEKSYVDSKLSSVYIYKGSVANYASLPTNVTVTGWVYNTLDTGDNYASIYENSTLTWDKLAGTVDLSAYSTTTQMNAAINAHHDSTKQDTLSAGNGITISSNTVSVDNSTVAMKSDLPVGQISIDFNGTATGTTQTLTNVVVGTTTYNVPQGQTYSAGNGLTLNNNTFAVDNSVVAMKSDLLVTATDLVI